MGQVLKIVTGVTWELEVMVTDNGDVKDLTDYTSGLHFDGETKTHVDGVITSAEGKIVFTIQESETSIPNPNTKHSRIGFSNENNGNYEVILDDTNNSTSQILASGKYLCTDSIQE